MDELNTQWLAQYEDQPNIKKVIQSYLTMNQNWKDLTDQIIAENYKLRIRLEEYAYLDEWSPIHKREKHPWYIRDKIQPLEPIGWCFE